MKFRHGERIRHTTTGAVYRIVDLPSRCRIAAPAEPAYSYCLARDPDITLWVRPQTEVEDGRFESVQPFTELTQPREHPMSTIASAARLTLRRRMAQLEDVVCEFLGLDDWSDELIAPRSLVQRAQALVQNGAGAVAPGFARENVLPGARWRSLDGGRVEDLHTGLTWSPTLDCGRVDHKTALKACADLRLGGHSDWRLPTIQELLSLVDYTRSDPAIDTERFPDTKSAFYWSSTAYAPYPAVYAWGVNFSYGNNGYYGRGFFNFVRAVRGPVARPGQ